MPSWILFAIILGALVVVGASVVLFVFVRNVRSAQGPDMTGKYPQGYWMGIGMCIGMVLGLISSLVVLLFDEMTAFIGMGPAMGSGMGVAIGAALEQKYKDKIRPLTEQEKQTRRWATFIGLLLVGLGVLALAGLLMLASMK